MWQTVHFEPRCLQNKQLLNNENTVPQQGTHKYVAAPIMCLNKYLIIIELMVTIGICCFYALYYITLPFFKVKPLWFNELVVTYINRDKQRQIIVLLRDWNNEHRDVLLTLPFLGSSPGQQWHIIMRKTPAHAAVVESGHHRTWRFKPCKKFVAECFLYCLFVLSYFVFPWQPCS